MTAPDQPIIAGTDCPPFSKEGIKQFFQVIVGRYGKNAILMTSDLPFGHPHDAPVAGTMP
ncbi:TPA: ATP-binding protein [Klebsiella oxytoca]|uniref:ATP-binding protein n=1 Tax=Klebsiella oxytoca TaxID=571 RepID=A0AAN5L641_KLEOX|nr:ATP-binding protein [Klebsiella oxytoca]